MSNSYCMMVDWQIKNALMFSTDNWFAFRAELSQASVLKPLSSVLVQREVVMSITGKPQM